MAAIYTNWLRSQNVWNRFVDLVTVIWLGIFFTNIAYPQLIPASIEMGLLCVFVADLVLKARAAPVFKSFLRTRWADILMVIPYFRIFRILKLTRLFRFLKVARITRVGRFPGLKALEALRRKARRIFQKIAKHGEKVEKPPMTG